MAMVEMNWRPTPKTLRDFGEVSLVLSTAVGLVLHWWKGLDARWALCICAAGLLVYLASRLWTPLAKPIYMTLMLVTFPIGWAVSHILLAIMYYLVFTPFGLVFRLIGRDRLHRDFDPDAPTYWVERCQTKEVNRYFRQF